MITDKYQDFLSRYQEIHLPFARYCTSLAFGIMATEDLMQESVLITLDTYDRIEQKHNLLAYMIGVVNNLVRNQKRRMKFSGQWNEAQSEYLTARVADPALLVDIEYLYRCLQSLPRGQKEALVLFEISGCSIREIAGVQDCSEGAVKARLHRARKALKEAYEGQANVRKLPLAECLAMFVAILIQSS